MVYYEHFGFQCLHQMQGVRLVSRVYDTAFKVAKEGLKECTTARIVAHHGDMLYSVYHNWTSARTASRQRESHLPPQPVAQRRSKWTVLAAIQGFVRGKFAGSSSPYAPHAKIQKNSIAKAASPKRMPKYAGTVRKRLLTATAPSAMASSEKMKVGRTNLQNSSRLCSAGTTYRKSLVTNVSKTPIAPKARDIHFTLSLSWQYQRQGWPPLGGFGAVDVASASLMSFCSTPPTGGVPDAQRPRSGAAGTPCWPSNVLLRFYHISRAARCHCITESWQRGSQCHGHEVPVHSRADQNGISSDSKSS